jgi:hypothetical protein
LQILKLGNCVRFSYLGKTFLLWQIIVLLLPQPYLPTLSSNSQIAYQVGEGRKASHHPCGCPLEEAACHSCRCLDCRGSCCTGSKKSASPACHQPDKNPSTIFIRVIPCGGPAELNVNSFGKIKFILTDLTFLLGVRSTPWARNTQEKPEHLFSPPPVPPPEIAAPLPTSLI